MKSTFIIITLLGLFSCNSNSSEEISETKSVFDNKSPEKISETWTSITRTYIIQSYVKKSKKNFDSFFLSTSNSIKSNYETLQSDSIFTSIISAKDTSFKYIKQKRANDMHCFNAILFNGKLFGTAEWYSKNGKWSKIGQFYNGIPCGNWTYYGDSLIVDSIVDKGKKDLLQKLATDSLLTKHIN